MDVVHFGNEPIKGDPQSLFRSLRSHAKADHHTALSSFIRSASVAVKDEIRQLSDDLKSAFRPFDTVLTWAEDSELCEGVLRGAIDGVLLVVAQISAYIGHLETDPASRQDSDNVALTGLGVGLLSAAAVSLSTTVADLPTLGANAVRIAFRMGVHVQSVSQHLEVLEPTGATDTWAYVVHNVSPLDAQAELDENMNREDIPATGKVFISAVSRTSVTVSGPPSRLKLLFCKSEFFRRATAIALPVYGGLCHAPHVYCLADSRRIVRDAGLSDKATPMVPLYSTSTGRPYQASTQLQLFEQVVSELLRSAICWDNVVNGLVNDCTTSAPLSLRVRLSSFGNSVPRLELDSALRVSLPEKDLTIQNLTTWLTDDSSTTTTTSNPAESKLAIVGMSCRFPGGSTDTDKFWQVLEQGLDVSRTIPSDRFDIETHFDSSGTQLNKTMTQYGCFVDNPGLFDAPFFHMSPREAQVVDPQMRLALVTAYEALERSGYVQDRTTSTSSERIGTYYGQAADDYREVNQGQEVGTYYIPGGCRAFGPGRINYFFKFSGPSYSIYTACSSGLAAIEVACQALWNGEVDMAVAGGVNILTNPHGFAGLGQGHFLTKGHNACKTCDASADGYCRADGVGSVVIKKLQDAEADNDNILGVILSAGINHSAEAVSITHPHAGHQAYLARQLLRRAAIHPHDISYLELHGTGTQAGDFEEMKGAMQVYAPLVGRRGKKSPLHIGAVKSNIGHGESVAGTAALIKVLLMLQKNSIPKHMGIKTEINPRLPTDLEKRNVHIPWDNTPWLAHADGKRRKVAINNFGAAGGNTMMILEEAPIRAVADRDERPVHVVTVSAKTKTSLAANIDRLIGYLDQHPDAELADVAYTTTARRYHHRLRVAVTATDIGHLRKALSQSLTKVDTIKAVGKSSNGPQIAFAFTGQGASHKSMALELYRDSTTFRDSIIRLDHLIKAQGFPSIIPALDGSHEKTHEHPPVVTQLTLVCVEIALAQYWQSLGIKPDVVVGHSLGEYAAMHVAGVISANDVIYMVGRRARLLEQKCTPRSHTMLAVRASLKQIEDSAPDHPFTVACINGPSDTVLSGTKNEMEDVALVLQAAGHRCMPLDVAFAFHSEQTDPVLDEFEAVAKGVRFEEPRIPVISPLVGNVVFDDNTLNPNYVRTATREAVDFYSALENALQIGAVSDETFWLEIGPHAVCTNFVKALIPSAIAVPSLRRDDDNWKTIGEAMATLHLGGFNVGWNEFHRSSEHKLRLLDLPTYSFDEKNYWLPYKGTWALTKGNDFYTKNTPISNDMTMLPQENDLQMTSVVHKLMEKTIEGSAGRVRVQSDLMHPEFLAAAYGHHMNGCGVVTSSIHADICYTVTAYLYRQFEPKVKDIAMDVTDLVVTKGLIAQTNRKLGQLIQVTASTEDILSGTVSMEWHNVDNQGRVHEESFATATVVLGNATNWLHSWSSNAHLVQSRIEALDALAVQGRASKFTRNMAYTLWASTLVDYEDKYRGMQSVVMYGLEAFADVELTAKEHGTWTVPPYFIDSVCHIAGFVMNCSDSVDYRSNFCITSGWDSMRFAKPLVAGQKYRNYVKMIATADDPSMFSGDVYIMQHDAIIGVVRGMRFRSFPRFLLPRFFSAQAEANIITTTSDPPATASTKTPTVVSFSKTSATQTSTQYTPSNSTDDRPLPTNLPSASPAPLKREQPKIETRQEEQTSSDDTISARALQLIATESGLELSDLVDEMGFSDLGVDSLMSLVLSEKLRAQLNVKVSGSLFLDYPTVGDLRQWLDECYG